MKKMGKVLLWILAVLVVFLLTYVIYMLTTYHRIEDGVSLSVEAPEAGMDTDSAGEALQTEEPYRILTYNIGFGAYTPDFSFFMDGGESSWAASKDSVIADVNAIGEFISSLSPDISFLQEIDFDSTRSYHVDEYKMLRDILNHYYSVFAQNYDSAFLAFPPTQPHGFCRAGLGTFSKYPIVSSVRRSLPVANSLNKFLDLDRCFSVSRVPVEGGKELVLINLHMSAYGNSAEIREGQIRMLCEEMEKEYEAGNYVICGGDFNHDLKVLEDDGSVRNTWAYPFPRESLPEHFAFAMDGLDEATREALWNSSRNADMPYVAGETYTVMLDGFILSDNITCLSYESIETGYTYSDHDPVVMNFKLEN